MHDIRHALKYEYALRRVPLKKSSSISKPRSRRSPRHGWPLLRTLSGAGINTVDINYHTDDNIIIISTLMASIKDRDFMLQTNRAILKPPADHSCSRKEAIKSQKCYIDGSCAAALKALHTEREFDVYDSTGCQRGFLQDSSDTEHQACAPKGVVECAFR